VRAPRTCRAFVAHWLHGRHPRWRGGGRRRGMRSATLPSRRKERARAGPCGLAGTRRAPSCTRRSAVTCPAFSPRRPTAALRRARLHPLPRVRGAVPRLCPPGLRRLPGRGPCSLLLQDARGVSLVQRSPGTRHRHLLHRARPSPGALPPVDAVAAHAGALLPWQRRPAPLRGAGPLRPGALRLSPRDAPGAPSPGPSSSSEPSARRPHLPTLRRHPPRRGRRPPLLPTAQAILEHLRLPSRPLPLAPATSPPQLDFW
jgi:hypothetical protein